MSAEDPHQAILRYLLEKGHGMAEADLLAQRVVRALQHLRPALPSDPKHPQGPLCYRCVHQQLVPGSHHSHCVNWVARVEGDPHGIRHGWFNWPIEFDPIWLKSCNGFQEKQPELIIP